jgi:hypothetical protein
MDVSTKLQLSRALRQEARLLLATMSHAEQSLLIDQMPTEQRPGATARPVLDEDADHLVQLGLAVRTTFGVDLTMLGRVAARVAYETRVNAASLGVTAPERRRNGQTRL